MENPLVSVIMPCYNCEKFIEQAIESVINQTYSNIELIIINDCSTDNTSKILEEYNNRNNVIVLFNDINKGVSYSRNRGVSIANGDWIAFIDSDDYWDVTKIEKQIDKIKETNSKFVFNSTAYVDENGKISKYSLNVPPKIDYCTLLKQNIISCSSVLIKKDLLKVHKMEYDNIHEDYYCWLRILKDGVIAHSVNYTLLYYRLSKKGKSSNKIKAIKMTLNVYRKMNLSKFQQLYYLMIYIYRNIQKYKKIKKGFRY